MTRSRRTQNRWESSLGESLPQVNGRLIVKQPPAPTLSQVEMIGVLNAALGTSHVVPDSEIDARFLIDGLIAEERKRKRSK